MLGMNAHFAFGSVGIGVGNTDPAGPTHTVFDLLSPTLQAGASDCAGPGTYELHSSHHPCPATVSQHPDWFVCGSGTEEFPPYQPYVDQWEWQTAAEYPCTT